jgi:hypothetical protein
VAVVEEVALVAAASVRGKEPECTDLIT